MTDAHDSSDVRCPTCGTKPVPDSKTMWNALVTKLTADAINIGVAITLVYLVVVLVYVAQTGQPSFGHFVYAAFAFIALVLADVLAIVHRLMTLGFPFRNWTEPGSGSEPHGE